MPKRAPPLGCSLVLSRSEKEQSPYPRCRNRVANCNLQSCHDATHPTPPKLLPLSPQGTTLPYEGKLKTPNRPPNPKCRLSAQARGSPQLPRNAQPVPAKEQGRCPRGHSLLGALWFFLAARKNKNKLRATEIMPPTAIYNLVMMQPSSHRSSYSP